MDRPNIMTYEPLVWSCADLLIGAGIKQSDFPAFMENVARKTGSNYCVYH
ncbi:hypothetical protein ACTML9_08500 [Porphyromonas levii]